MHREKCTENALRKMYCKCIERNVPMAMLYIHIATVGNTIQTVNFPMYDTYMSTPGNTAKLGSTDSNIQTAQRGPSLVGSEPTMH